MNAVLSGRNSVWALSGMEHGLVRIWASEWVDEAVFWIRSGISHCSAVLKNRKRFFLFDILLADMFIFGKGFRRSNLPDPLQYLHGPPRGRDHAAEDLWPKHKSWVGYKIWSLVAVFAGRLQGMRSRCTQFIAWPHTDPHSDEVGSGESPFAGGGLR